MSVNEIIDALLRHEITRQQAIDMLGGRTGRRPYEPQAVSVDAMLRKPEVVRLTGRSHVSLFNATKAGLFTPPLRIGPHAVAWPESEIRALNEARATGRSDEEIRHLVQKLLAVRGGNATSSSGVPAVPRPKK